MLTAAQVASIRGTVEESLPQTCTIQRKTTASDSGGGSSESWASLTANVPCRVAPTGGGEQASSSNRSDQIADDTTHVVTLPAQQDISEADRLVIGGDTFNVLLVRKRGDWELSRRVEVRET